jgi:ABC-2 type transport system permease protein
VRRRRLLGMLRKEFLELRRNPGLLVPVLLVAVSVLALPLLIAVGIPAWTGQRLADDSDLARLSQLAGPPDGLSDEAQVQFSLFQEFLVLLLLTPITGAMALAAHSIVGEKQARTLEPLLATPLTTAELLVAKVVGALWPSQVIAFACVGLYLVLIEVSALPGVASAMVNARTALLVLLVGPAASLNALQAAILVSSRVNDARTAQQVGVLLIVPIGGLVVAQFTGALWLSSALLAMIGLVLLGVWGVLVAASVALFRRETVLTRWR